MTSDSVNDITARHLDHLDSLRRRHAYQLNSRVGCNDYRPITYEVQYRQDTRRYRFLIHKHDYCCPFSSIVFNIEDVSKCGSATIFKPVARTSVTCPRSISLIGPIITYVEIEPVFRTSRLMLTPYTCPFSSHLIATFGSLMSSFCPDDITTFFS